MLFHLSSKITETVKFNSSVPCETGTSLTFDSTIWVRTIIGCGGICGAVPSVIEIARPKVRCAACARISAFARASAKAFFKASSRPRVESATVKVRPEA